MSVIKRKRKESKFEVFHHWYKVRREVTELLLRNFGYDYAKAEKRISRNFNDLQYHELSSSDKERYLKLKNRNEAFDKWFIEDQRKAVIDCIREISKYIFLANSIYPYYSEELIERRICQDKAIGACHVLMQEVQYTIDTIPVDINKYARFSELIGREIELIKGWRKSDNKFKRATTNTATNFANVNSNGNANNNNASNTNGVRPDFDPLLK